MTDERLMVPVSIGELIDKITILELKERHIQDRARLENVRTELSELTALWHDQAGTETVEAALAGLREVNAALWEVEDRLREYEAAGRFGEEFVAAARSVYKLNDRRAALKYQINTALGSRLVEEKSYAGGGT